MSVRDLVGLTLLAGVATSFAACGRTDAVSADAPASAEDGIEIVDARPTETTMEPMPRKAKTPKAAPPRSERRFPTAPPPGDYPLVGDEAGLEGGYGGQVRLRGRYVETVMSARPDAKPVGHVAIAVGRIEVALLAPWDPDALRPEAEVAELAGKEVDVVGRLAASIPQQHPGVPAAQRVMPCLVEVLSLAPAP